MSIATRIKAAFRSRTHWDVVSQLLKSQQSSSGVSVNETTAMNSSAVWNALTLISETMSTVPLQVFRKTEEGRELYTSHPLYPVLHDKANRIESAQAFRETFFWNMEMRGIGIAEKVRSLSGEVQELWNISPEELIEITLDDGGRLQFHMQNGKVYGQDKIFYCYGPGKQGLTPRSRLKIAAEAIGLGLASQEFGSRYFGQGTHNGGFLLREGKPLSKEGFDRLREQMNDQYQGLGNTHKLMILEEGMKFTPAGMSNEDSQFLETRKFQIAEIARFFNVKPHMLGDLERATFSNIEHQGIEAVMYCWRPRAIRFQQAINTQLLNPIERERVYAEHNLNGLMQGDLKSQADVWHLLLQDGVLNADEVRSMMNMNNQPEGQGEIYFMPMNMGDKAKLEELPVPDKLQQPKLRNVTPPIKALPLSNIADYRSWAESLAEQYEQEYDTFDTEAYVRGVGKILSGLEKRGVSAQEYTRMRNAFRYEGMKAGGVKFVIWRSKKDCPHCQHLNGKVVPIGEAFVDGIRHAPIVQGCECDVEAVR